MAQITASIIKDLREKTGVGMMDCKKALNETAGDFEAAIDWLRTNGLSKAAKKADRVAAEGLVGLVCQGNKGAVVEVNAETDFVARNDKFQDFVAEVTQVALKSDGTIDGLKAADYPGTGRSVADELTQRIATIGENMSLRRVVALSVDQGVVAGYVHNALKDGIGKIGVLVALDSTAESDKLEAFGKKIAMHIAAARPQALTVEALDPDMVAREREVQMETARGEGKPEEIIQKMIEGRMRKFYQEVVLLEQTFVMDGESRVADIMAAFAKDVGADVTIKAFVRFELGEGIERKEDNFADEVAALAS